MIYREALISDCEQIALLHAESWRRTYHGLFSDQFLEQEADADRLQVWTQRLSSSAANQAVFVAEHIAGRINGFICVYGGEDLHWGSLLDNLHVRHADRGRGIGSHLMEYAFAWLAQHFADSGVYLWVMQANQRARDFYTNRGAGDAGVVMKPNPVGGGSAANCRYFWDDPQQYLSVHSSLQQ